MYLRILDVSNNKTLMPKLFLKHTIRYLDSRYCIGIRYLFATYLPGIMTYVDTLIRQCHKYILLYNTYTVIFSLIIIKQSHKDSPSLVLPLNLNITFFFSIMYR